MSGIPISPSASASSPHYYRIGIIGSKSSGKTCLLAALGMARSPNSRGYSASMMPPEDTAGAALLDGYKWIKEAINALERGLWPPPNSNEDTRRSVRMRFTDGQTRQKYVELFDYSGELLNPDEAQADVAKRLRELLREMDGLIVLAEHPQPEEISTALAKELNGLLSVFALLNDERRRNPKAATREIPIVMAVNKWDRSPHFDALSDAENQTRLLSSFLDSTPQPFHASVGKALRPSAGERFKSFPVSAVGPVRRDTEGRELPPAAGTLHSLGVEDPFLWLIEQRDDMDLLEQEERIRRRTNWFRLPWLPWLRRHDFCALQSRFDRRTPEGGRTTRLAKAVWLLALRQVLVYASALLLVEGAWDIWMHRNALSHIENPSHKDGWQEGTAWLRDYGQSSPARHLFYGLRLTKQSALDSAQRIERKKDEEAFSPVPKLLAGTQTKESVLDEAEKLAQDQMAQFPNSSFNEDRKHVVATVQRIRRELEFEKHLLNWRHKLESMRLTPDDSEQQTRIKIEDVATLLGTVRDSQEVPLDGPLREQWKVLLNDIDAARGKLASGKLRLGLIGKVRQALAATDYVQAADLLAGQEFKVNPDPDLRNEFQLNIGTWVQEKCSNLSKQGEYWKAAKVYAEQFLEPARRSILGGAAESIKETIQNVDKQGDKYLYELAQKNKSNDSLDLYLTEAPIKSMASEVAAYRKWLQERETPRRLTFRLVRIEWAPGHEQSWFCSTAIKLFVEDEKDDRNSNTENNKRTGTTANSDGIRSVSIEKMVQKKSLEVTFQLFEIGKLGGWEKLISKSRTGSAEDIYKQSGAYDDAGNRFVIEVEGVLPEPFLPPLWQPPQ